MKRNRLFLTILVLLIHHSCVTIAQEVEQRTLENFLGVLENRFNVVFTYADENIEEVTVNIPLNNLTLEKYLDELENQTGLIFNKLDSRYIAIQKKTIDNSAITVKGTVIDANTNEQLIGAIIYTNSRYTLSDKNGKFFIQIKPDLDSVLTIKYIGYKNLIISKDEWDNDSDIFFALTQDIFELNEVVVNYIATGIDKLADGSIQLNNQNLEILPGLSEPDVLHTAQVLPGILSVNETVSYINTRGGTNDQSLFLWEGVKMYHTGHLFGLISGFNSQLIHKTTIIKNGTSAAFGEGVSGTIDMKLQNYLDSDFKVSAGFNLLNADAIINIPVSKKLSLQLEARHSINDFVITPTYRDYYWRAFENTDVLSDTSDISHYHDFSFYDLSFKFLYDVSEKDKIRLSFLNMKDAIKYEESEWVNDTLERMMSHLKQLSILSGFDYAREWSNKLSTNISTYISSYSLDGYNSELLSGQNHAQENDVLDWGIKFDSKYKIGKKVNLSNGYMFDEIGNRNQDNINKPDYSRDVKDVLRIQSLYSEAEMKSLLNRLYMRVGIRAVYLHEFKAILPEPRVALNFKITDDISFKLLAEKKSQYTTQVIDYQTDFLGVEKRKWVLSDNISVPVTKSRQLSLGLQYNHEHFLLSVEGYKKKVEGIITLSQGFQNQFQYVYAIGNYDTEGIEALINKRFKKLNIWLNYSFSLNNYFFGELEPSTFPNNLDIRHVATLGGSYNIKNFEVSSGFNFRTGKPYSKPLFENQSRADEIVYESPNSSRTDDFIRLDVSAKYNFEIWKMKGNLGMSVWNVLNRENVIGIYYVQGKNSIEQVTQQALGITPNMNLRLLFN